MQLTLLLVALFIIRYVGAQIPKPCANIESLSARACCPVPKSPENAGQCGVNLGRGSCEAIAIPDLKFNATERDVRNNWPIQYFNMTCRCAENFGGVDCGECSFAYNDGTDCTEKTIRPRKSVSDMTDRDWKQYRDILNMTKFTASRYKVVTIDFTNDLQRMVDTMVNPTTYDLFAWMHHTVARDNEKTKDTPNIVDFAHEGPGFPTWHRLFLLWLEREIQVLIEDHTFRLSYWDWTDQDQREILFTRDKLGENIDGIVNGDIFETWHTICWEDISDQNFPIAICNPSTKTSENLRRCPDATSCSKTNKNWPSVKDVNDAISLESYDASPYNRYVKGTDSSYRNFMEGFIIEDGSDCGSDTMCTTDETGVTVRRKIHNSVHIILGIGDLKDGANTPFNKQGVMSDVAASANDPVFINHHAMIDCIFERWIQKNKNKNLAYPTSSEIREGHRGTDAIVPIIPIYMEKEMFMPADNFGYTCDANMDPTDTDATTNPTGTGGNKIPSDTNPTSPDTGVTTNLSNTIIVIIVAVIMVNLVIGGGN